MRVGIHKNKRVFERLVIEWRDRVGIRKMVKRRR